jgi:excinuclease ABC subunit B
MDLDVGERLRALRAEMFAAAENLEFEKAAKLRDQIKTLEQESGESADGDAMFDPYAKKKKPAKGKARSGAQAGGGGWKAAKRRSSKWKP